MNIADLQHKNIIIWGVGREGSAAADFIRAVVPDARLSFVDEGSAALPDALAAYPIARGAAIAAALASADMVVKSPGVSLYHPLLDDLKARQIPITSLMNLWFAARAPDAKAKTICVTGTKGKSTTAALLAHTLTKLGKRVALMGNIGTALTHDADKDADYAVIEVSSYQAATFDGLCDIALLTALYPEHLDWHKSLQAYYGDKLNLLRRARTRIVTRQAADTIQAAALSIGDALIVHQPDALHVESDGIYDGVTWIGKLANDHLSRAHNLANVCLILEAMRQLGFDMRLALAAMEDFSSLPHRQNELGVKNGLLYVDDSISTTPQSAIAAMQAYSGRAICLIAGGFDRGIDYTPLVDYIEQNHIHAVICLGPSGARIAAMIKARHHHQLCSASTIDDAVTWARQNTPPGGVILLSPAASSYGMFKNFEERGDAFAKAAGFSDGVAST